MTLQKRCFSAGSKLSYPFSPAVEIGGFVYVSGTMATDDDGRLIPGDIQSQTRKTLDRIAAVLTQAGSSLQKTSSVQVYLRNAADFPAMNEVYREYRRTSLPVRTTIAAQLVLPGALIEVSAIAVAQDAPRHSVLPEGWKPSPNPYSYGVLIGDTLFMSGLLARNPKDNSAPARDIRVQTRAVMENAGAILAAHGMSYADVVSSKIYLSSKADFQAMNEEYRAFFHTPPPARATLVAGLMNPDYLVEITLTAVRSADRASYTAPSEDGTAGRPNPNFSSAIRVGNRLYLSGMLGLGKENRVNTGLQTADALSAIGRTLNAAGFEWSHVVDGVVYLADIDDFQAMNQAYRRIFRSEFPARTTVGTGLVVPDALAEIMLTAVKG